MRSSLALATLAVTLGVLLGMYSSVEPEMPLNSRWSMAPEECTEKLEIECGVEVERTVVACAKAFETEGADVIADIKCAKDLLSDKKYCWPCVCAIAKKKGWHVVGC